MATLKDYLPAIFAFGLVWGAPAAYLYYDSHKTPQQAEQSVDDDPAALAVTVLPAGVEEQWLAFVDERMETLIERRGDMLAIKDPMTIASGQTGSFVSLNMPYSISCPLYGQITFGSGDSAIDVYVFWMTSGSAKQTPEPAPTNDNSIASLIMPAEPVLGVSPASKAAQGLRQKLCVRIAEDLQKLLKVSALPQALTDP
jgi:hypothetical protein